MYVFDEVAADQDPHFRRYFYETLLPELKSAGKTVVVVSHDDRYFHARGPRAANGLRQVKRASPRRCEEQPRKRPAKRTKKSASQEPDRPHEQE